MPTDGPTTRIAQAAPGLGTAEVGPAWLFDFAPRPDARIRLICAHHAGGSYTYFEKWPDALPDDVEVLSVNLPGRGNRRNEDLIRDLHTVVEQLAAALEPHLDRPYAMFGDSIGALICFELIRRLRRAGKPLPVRLFASGMVAPHIVWWNPDAPLHRLPDAELFQGLVRDAGMLDERSLADDELRTLMLPVLRADLEMAESYRYTEEAPLDLPITASRGEDDILLAPAQLQGWSELTNGAFEHLTFPGSHFYSRKQRRELLAIIYTRLEEDLASFPRSVVDGASHPYPRKCLHALFSDQVERTPEAPALVGADRCYSYRELDAETNTLARWLLRAGVRRGDLVGIRMERCVEHVIALIAINKAGGVFMPLDTTYPADTLRVFVQASGAAIFLSKPAWIDPLPRDVKEMTQWVAMGDGWQENCRASASAASGTKLPQTSPDELAFMAMSSGTSGAPKGICQSHRACVNAYWHRYVNAPYGRREREACNVYFIWYVWLPLLCGASAHIVADDVVYDPRLLVSFIAEHEITRATISPSLLEQVLRTPGLDLECSLRSLKNVTIIGELVPCALIAAFHWVAPQCTFTHAYGCAETHDAVSRAFTRTDTIAAMQRVAPVGAPQINQRIRVLDASHRPQPRGVPGEIFVGGDSLATGYFRDEELTAARFIADPLCNDGSRLFKTGDRGRILLDGDLEVLGRMDSMIKLRGYSVMPGAVEAAMLAHPALSNAVVVAVVDETTGRPDHLVAYVVPACFDNDAARLGDLRGFLLQRLPPHAIPTFVVPLRSLPVGNRSNSKIDRRDLPAPDPRHRLSAVERKIAPRNDGEAEVARIWSEVLGIESVGVEEDFFALGGHSLLAAELCGRVNESLGWHLRVADVFRHPTVARLSVYVMNSAPRGSGC